MADYDLVVVGNNAAARKAAIAAREQSARVALIAVAPEPIPYPFLLRQWIQAQSQMPLVEWCKAMTLRLQTSRTPAWLASLGIEQIDGVAEFRSKPKLQVQTQNRVLRSQRYLLCLDADLTVPDLPGAWLSSADVITRLDDPTQPLVDPVLVAGDGPVAASLSQSLGRLGYTVHLLCSDAHVLPWEDAEAAWRIQAYLEADRVHIHPHCPIKAVTATSPSYQVETAQGVLEAGSLVWAVEPTAAMINPNQIAISLRHTSQGVWVNPQFQTAIPQIYACGSVLGGYTLADLADYEATVAVHNALGAKQIAEYGTLPWAIPTVPELARVGLTEVQALQTGSSFQVFYPSDQQPLSGQLQDQPRWCKVLVQSNGQILGAHMVGVGAVESIHLIALAMKKRCHVLELAELAAFGSSFGSIVGEIPRQWRQKAG